MKLVVGPKDISDESNDWPNVEADEPVVASYDTTLNTGNDFVAPVVFGHIMFKIPHDDDDDDLIFNDASTHTVICV